MSIHTDRIQAVPNFCSVKTLAAPAVLAGLYLLAVMPRMTGKPDFTPFDTKFFAHRGIHDNGSDAPENSMAAFRKAVEAGYGIELDIQLTADHVPVIFHDFTLERACGAPGSVKDYTFEELMKFRLFGSEERIPALKDFLRMVKGRVPLIVEYKSEDRDMTVCRMRGQLSDGFMHDKKYQTLRKLPMVFPLQFLLANFLSKPDFIAYNCIYEGNLSRRLCRHLYRAKTAAWTIKSSDQLKKAAPYFDVFIFDSFLP